MHRIPLALYETISASDAKQCLESNRYFIKNLIILKDVADLLAKQDCSIKLRRCLKKGNSNDLSSQSVSVKRLRVLSEGIGAVNVVEGLPAVPDVSGSQVQHEVRADTRQLVAGAEESSVVVPEASERLLLTSQVALTQETGEDELFSGEAGRGRGRGRGGRGRGRTPSEKKS